jgi:putative peptide zinc metalloprotease protein
VFVPDILEASAIPVRLDRVDLANATLLDIPYLASVHGGPLPTEQDGSGRLLTLEPLYRVVMKPIGMDGAFIQQVMPGTVRLPGQSVSILARMGRQIAAVFIRESGF